MAPRLYVFPTRAEEEDPAWDYYNADPDYFLLSAWQAWAFIYGRDGEPFRLWSLETFTKPYKDIFKERKYNGNI